MISDRMSAKPRAITLGPSGSADENSCLADTLFAIACGAAACRQWLAQDPPRLDEVDTALHSIAAAAARFQHSAEAR